MKIRFTVALLLLAASCGLGTFSAPQVLAAPSADTKTATSREKFRIPYAPPAEVTSEVVIPHAPPVAPAVSDEDCGCNPVVSTSATPTAAPSLGVPDAATAIATDPQSESGSTVPGKKLSISVSAVCLNTQHAWGSASASGYTEAEGPPTVTISAAGKSSSGTGSASLTVNSDAASVTFTATAPGYDSVTATADVLQKKEHDYTAEINGKIIDPINSFADKISSIPVIGEKLANKIKPDIKTATAKGILADCCKDEKKVKDGKKYADASATANFSLDAGNFSKDLASFKVQKRGELEISASLDYSLPLSARGNGTFSGHYQTIACDGKACLTVNGDMSGTAGGPTSVKAKLELTLPAPLDLLNQSVDYGIYVANVTSSFHVLGKYAQCANPVLSGRFYSDGATLTVPPISVPIPALLQQYAGFDESIPVTTASESYKLWDKELFEF